MEKKIYAKGDRDCAFVEMFSGKAFPVWYHVKKALKEAKD